MPIYDYLNKFREISFHMPGHKGNLSLPLVDVTELSGTDNLMCPDGIIREAQEEMATVLEKKEAFFLTNGASSGILAGILAVAKEGEQVLVDRNCHVSVLNGLILSGAVPKFVYPKLNSAFGIPKPLCANDITYNGEKAMVVTSPTYYGEVGDMDAIRHTIGDALLLQDESHGAHFYFCEAHKALRTKASDVTVLSFHKTMPTLNQGAVLATNSNRISSKKLKQAINMVTTTSPSYPILSSLDYSRMEGKKLYGNDVILQGVHHLKETLQQKAPFLVLDNQDRYKLLLNCSQCNLSASQIQKILEDQYSIYIEGVFGDNLLLMFSPCNTEEELSILSQALLSLPLKQSNRKTLTEIPILRLSQGLSPREAYFAEGEMVSKEQAVGRVSKENITRFPPCVPMVTIGEIITKEAVGYLDRDFIEVVR